jgi:PIN domain nuclease of toxin-antitoxin system
MILLLDTHVLVWAVEDPGKLGSKTKRMLTTRTHERWISAISVLEIARLYEAGQITLSIDLRQWIDGAVRDLRARLIVVDALAALEAYSLPAVFHRDPADRILVACARLHNATLITADERILRYDHVRSLNGRS